jgi:hypothetical protein
MQKYGKEFMKVKDKAYKLHALAERGDGAEAENAKTRLAELLVKHELDFKDVFGNESPRVFHVHNKNEGGVLLKKIIASVSPFAKIHVSDVKGGVATITATLSDEEELEVKEKMRYFWEAWNQDKALFFSAFLNKHGNYFVPSIINDEGEKVPMEEEIEEPKEGQKESPKLSPSELSDVHKLMQVLKFRYYTKTKNMIDYEGRNDVTI